MTASIPFIKPLIDQYYPRFLSGLSISFTMQSQQLSRLENGPGDYDVFSSSRRVDDVGDLSEQELCPMENLKSSRGTDCEVTVR
jgi:hypothetical protein